MDFARVNVWLRIAFVLLVTAFTGGLIALFTQAVARALGNDVNLGIYMLLTGWIFRLGLLALIVGLFREVVKRAR